MLTKPDLEDSFLTVANYKFTSVNIFSSNNDLGSALSVTRVVLTPGVRAARYFYPFADHVYYLFVPT